MTNEHTRKPRRRATNTAAPANAPSRSAAAIIDADDATLLEDEAHGADEGLPEKPPIDLSALDAPGSDSDRAEQQRELVRRCLAEEQRQTGLAKGALGTAISTVLAAGVAESDVPGAKELVRARGLALGNGPWVNSVYGLFTNSRGQPLDPNDQVGKVSAGQRVNALKNLKVAVEKRLGHVPPPTAEGVEANYAIFREEGGFSRLKAPAKGGGFTSNAGVIPQDRKRLKERKIRRGERHLAGAGRAKRGSGSDLPAQVRVLLEIDGKLVPWGEVPRASPLGEAIVGLRAEPEPVVTLLADACRLGKQCIPELQTSRKDARGKPIVGGRHLILRANRSILLTSRGQDTSMVVEVVPDPGLAGALAPEPLLGDLWGNPQSLDNLEANLAADDRDLRFGFSFDHMPPEPADTATHCRWLLACELPAESAKATDINMALTYATSWPQDGAVAPLDVIKRDDVDFGFSTVIPRSEFVAHAADHAKGLAKASKDARTPVLVLHFNQDVISFSDAKGEVELLHDAGEPPNIRCKTARVRAPDWARAFGAIAELALIGDGVRFEVDPRGIARFTARTAQAVFYVWLPLCTQNGNHFQKFFGPITFVPWPMATSGGEERATSPTPSGFDSGGSAGTDEGSSSADQDRTEPGADTDESKEGAGEADRQPGGDADRPGDALARSAESGANDVEAEALEGEIDSWSSSRAEVEALKVEVADGEERIKAIDAEIEERDRARQAKAPSKGSRGRR